MREISWTHNMLIMMSAKTDEAREFYLTLTAKNNYSKRELERQFRSPINRIYWGVFFINH